MSTKLWVPLPSEYNDFRVFLTEAWRVLGLPSPTPRQYEIAEYLQGKDRRRGLQAFRGVGKSWESAVWVLFCLRHNPQYKVLVVSASKERADNFTTFTRMLMDEWPLLHCLIPKDSQRDSRISFDVAPATPAQAPSVKSVGIFGQMSGSRADEIIADDVEVPNNSETQPKRDKLLARIGEFEDILKPGGKITFLGTPQTEDSIYTKLKSKGYKVLIIPARFPEPQTIYSKYGESLSPSIARVSEDMPEMVGKSTDPKRFTNADLEERELSKGKSSFALQFMLDTSLSDADKYPLRLRDIIIHSVDIENAPEKLVYSNDPRHKVNIPSVGLKGDYFYHPAITAGDYLPYTGTVMYVDPSGRGADETAFAVVKMLNGNLFVPSGGIGGFPGGYEDETLMRIANTAKTLKVNTIMVESNFGDGMFNKLLLPYLKKIHPCELLEDRVNSQKELRIIETLEPLLNQHRLIIDERVIEQDRKHSGKSVSPEEALYKQLFYQLTRITKQRNSLRHDDRIDCLAGACRYWTDAVAQSQEDAMAQRKEEIDELHRKGLTRGYGSTIIYGLMGMSAQQIAQACEEKSFDSPLLDF